MKYDIQTLRRWKFWKPRSIGSYSGLLVLAWGFLLGGILNITLNRVLYLTYKSNGHSTFLQILLIPFLVIFSAIFPLASILAEVVISRYRLVSYSLRAVWILSLMNCALAVTDSLVPAIASTLHNVQLYVTLMPQVVLFGAFLTGAVPLGIDQITVGSAANISAFILWLIWSILSGAAMFDNIDGILYHYFESSDNGADMMSLLSVILLSVGLLLDFCFNHRLVKEPVTVNPVTLIFKVLKYAAKHKYPVRRSAFTYCDDQQPSRLDYGKSKYGGPFTTEQVEDVKTFWRMTLVIFVLSLVSIPLQAHYLSMISKHRVTTKNYLQAVLQNDNIFIMGPITIAVPLYELLVYPSLRKSIPNLFRLSGIGTSITVFLSLYGLTIETIEYFISNGNTQCTFLHQFVPSRCAFLYLPSKVIIGMAIVLLMKWVGEFVSAQAPYNMKGIHIGLAFSLYTLFLIPGIVMYLAWQSKCYDKNKTRMCGIWFYLNLLVVAVVSLVLLICVVRWYKARERDDITGYQNMVEEIYSKYQEQEREEKLQEHTSNSTIN